MRVRAYGLRHVPGRGTPGAVDEEKKGEEREEEECHTGEKKVSDEEESRRLEYQANGPCNSVPYDRVRRLSRPRAKSLAKSR